MVKIPKVNNKDQILKAPGEKVWTIYKDKSIEL